MDDYETTVQSDVSIKMVAVHFDQFAYACQYFASGVEANNGYGCDHPEQEEYCGESGNRQGCCYSYSCPLGVKACQDDLNNPAIDWSNCAPGGEIVDSEYHLVCVDTAQSNDEHEALTRYHAYMNRYSDPHEDQKREKRRMLSMAMHLVYEDRGTTIPIVADALYSAVNGDPEAGLHLAPEQAELVHKAVESQTVPTPGWCVENVFHVLCRMNQQSYHRRYPDTTKLLEWQPFTPHRPTDDEQLADELDFYLVYADKGKLAETGLYDVVLAISRQVQRRLVESWEEYQSAGRKVRLDEDGLLAPDAIGSVANLLHMTYRYGAGNTQISLSEEHRQTLKEIASSRDAENLYDDHAVFLDLDNMYRYCYAAKTESAHIYYRKPTYGPFRNDNMYRTLWILHQMVDVCVGPHTEDTFEKLYDVLCDLTHRWRVHVIKETWLRRKEAE